MPSFVAPRYLWVYRDAIFCYFTIFLNPPRCYLFVAPRYFRFHRDALFCRFTILSYFHELLLNSNGNISVTPLLSGAALRARSSKSWRAGRVHDQHGVRLKPAIYHDTFCPIERYILYLPRFCFLLFHALDFTEFLIFTTMPSAFKMGVKKRSALHESLVLPSRFIFQHFTIACFDRAVLSFGTSR